MENLNVGGIGALLPGLLTAQTITASCGNGPTGLVGNIDVTGTVVLGTPVDVPPPPNTVMPITLPILGNVGQIILNGQTATTVGNVSSLEVRGIEIQTTGVFGILAGLNLTILEAECSVTLPTSSSLSPTFGPTTGGTLVTINGTNFLQLAGVTFGGTPGTSVNVISDTQLTVLSPAHAAGPVNVVVTTAGGVTTSLPYTYIPVPVITSLSPDTGPTSGGQTVTITGANFSSPASVLFGANAGTVTNVTPTTSR